MEYDSQHGFDPPTRGAAATVLGCIDLVRHWAVRRDANSFFHACGRHAPQLGPLVCHPALFMGGVGMGDSDRTPLRSQTSASPTEAFFRVADAHRRVCVTICLLSGGWNAWLQEFLNPFALTAGPEPFVHLWFDKFFNGLLSSV